MAKRISSPPPTLAGYSYVRPLGSGGFADVFLYEQDMPRRVAAVKVLLADAVNPDVLRAFNAEADISARLSAHPSIVTIYQASISADGRPYFAMEYCPDTMSARYRKAPVPIAEVLDAGVRIAGALETVHRAGLLHRDIKPSNVLINSLGSPVLADFGIAAAVVDAGESDVFAMSVPWSSPEVLQERVTGSVPSEIWSLAATLYTLLAGRTPFEVDDRASNSRDQLRQRIIRARYTPIPVPGMPPILDQILAAAMHRDPARRFASMEEFADRLRWAQYELGIAPTAFEAASAEWAAAAPVSFADTGSRGPVITTVAPDSRRAARAEKQKTSLRGRDEPAAASGGRSPVVAGVVGALIGAAAIAAIGAAVLTMTGVL
ncbi:serine/threonine protein kinase [Microbacterium esteraromaticum]|uniref:non-specific serine/threonine protein kinase n=1 Tax=Microbacterium esteraromaticum TaxID=57043 RepID=A0A7D8AFE5_9MICO|nr:serine/threonine-protein kinase [Microbacterium esteraromaticum]QMU97062.1 serine/threonine protein kinase [Microbacterium esteraromaticum]